MSSLSIRLVEQWLSGGPWKGDGSINRLDAIIGVASLRKIAPMPWFHRYYIGRARSQRERAILKGRGPAIARMLSLDA